MQVNIVQNLVLPVVAERDMIEIDAVFQFRYMAWMLFLYDVVRRFQYLIHTLHRRQAARNHIACFREIFQRVDDAVQDNHVIDKGRSIYRRVIAQYQRTAEPQYENYQHRAQKLTHRVSHRLAGRYAARSVAVFIAALVEAVNHLFFGGKGFDYAHTSESFFKLRHGFAPFSLSFKRLTLQLTPDLSHQPSHCRQYEDGKQRKLPTDDKQGGEIRNNQDGVFQQHV